MVTLSYDVLLRIFEFASESELNEVVIDSDSIEVQPWPSTHSSRVLDFSLVCRDWKVAAQQTLFRSVILVGSNSALLFLRTVTERKDLARQTRRMIVSLTHGQTYGYMPQHMLDGTIEERKGEDWGQASTSLDLVKCINVCTTLRHLHIEPLHRIVREPLLLALSTKELTSLVITPHIGSIRNSSPVNSIFHLKDLTSLLTCTLKHVRLDFHHFYSPRILPLVPYQCTSITTLILSTDITSAHFLAFLSIVGPTLETLHLTTSEHPTLLEETPPLLSDCIIAWSTTFSTLTKLHLQPFPPYFIPILPQLENLELFSTVTLESHLNYISNLPTNLKQFILLDHSDGLDEEMWHNLLWSLKAHSHSLSKSLGVVTVVDSNSAAEELFFGLLTVERVPWATINEFLEF